MPRLADQQAELSAALLDPAAPLPAGWVGPDGRADLKRFGVYRNNVASSLIEVLREAYPAVHRLVGDEYFSALAKLFIQAHPPQSPVMLDYGAAFPPYLAAFEPLAGLPYLADVARIERAWLEAYHAADVASTPCEALTSTLGAVAPERAGELHLELHPSVRIVRSAWPALTIWQMNVGERPMERIDLQGAGEDTLLSRPQAQVTARPMPAGEAEFLHSLLAGECLAQAAQQAIGRHAEFDLARQLAVALSEGLVIRAWLPDEARIGPPIEPPIEPPRER